MGLNLCLTNEELAVIDALDDGTLYAASNLVKELFSYPYLSDSRLLVSRNAQGQPTGYIPLGLYASNEGQLIASYIPAIPASPPISPTYTPGAENVIANLDQLLDETATYFDVDVVAQHDFSYFEETASAYCMPLDKYLPYLSTSRRKDFKRKLKNANKYQIEAGDLNDVLNAWSWMKQVWEKRGAYDSDHVRRVVRWLSEIQASGRAIMKVDKYMLNGKTVGVNCCVIHHYYGITHIDDYLTWYDASIASGLGIVSAINNLTDPNYYGARYNLGLPGFYGKTFGGHEYKWDIFPENIRLSQSIVNLDPELSAESDIIFADEFL
ncbi:MAG TPA: hypothetical protein ENJ51_10955 [Leucothrix mucor]|uniref:BioF2-like acetyltransferase domain-containing protein n=1 Tax=Leucothrix mucor TaxID=45248 RepID=A0A7V2T1A2_LEUMU|nr:hypothetical protein [Leucothrix mucor]